MGPKSCSGPNSPLLFLSSSYILYSDVTFQKDESILKGEEGGDDVSDVGSFTTNCQQVFRASQEKGLHKSVFSLSLSLFAEPHLEELKMCAWMMMGLSGASPQRNKMLMLL